MSIGNRNSVRPDLLLSDQDSNLRLVVEVKARNVTMTADEYEQLSSYLRLNQAKFGLLIGKNISLMYNSLVEPPVKLAEIPFRPDASDGVKLSNLLDITNGDFSELKFEEFCNEFRGKLKLKEETEEILKILTSESGIADIADAIKTSRILERFNSISIDKALEKLKIVRKEEERAPIVNVAVNSVSVGRTQGVQTDRIDLLDENLIPTGLKPIEFIIEGEQYNVKSWKDVADITLQKAFEINSNAFDSSKYIARREDYENGRVYLRTPTSIGNTGYIYEANMSAMLILRAYIWRMAQIVGFKQIECTVRNAA